MNGVCNGQRWEHFPHDADIGVRGIGQIRSQAFEQAALALTGVVTDPKSITEQEEHILPVKLQTTNYYWSIG